MMKVSSVALLNISQGDLPYGSSIGKITMPVVRTRFPLQCQIPSDKM